MVIALMAFAVQSGRQRAAEEAERAARSAEIRADQERERRRAADVDRCMAIIAGWADVTISGDSGFNRMAQTFGMQSPQFQVVSDIYLNWMQIAPQHGGEYAIQQLLPVMREHCQGDANRAVVLRNPP